MNLQRLLIVSTILIVIAGIFAFRVKKRKNPDLTMRQFLDLDMKFLFSCDGLKVTMVGMAGGLMFGFIDNAGLWFGMDALEDKLRSMGITDANTLGGYGNTYSDAVGAFLGTFVSVIVSEYTNVDINNTPIWANAIGIIIGCLIGMYFGKMFGAKKPEEKKASFSLIM